MKATAEQRRKDRNRAAIRQEALKNSPVKIEAEYTIPIEHHNPMEPHAAIAVWEGEKLTLFR